LTPGRFQRARLLARLILVCLAASILLAAAACPYAGHYLIVDEPLTRADAIVVLDGPAVRWMEGVDLYREGMAPHILLSPGMADPTADRVRAMGVVFPAKIDLVRSAMVQLGVPAGAMTVLPHPVDNTADEAAQTRPVALQRGWTSLIVVTSKYHTRRTGYAFEREFAGTSVRIQVKGSRHDRVSPDGWWRSRSDLRYVVSELQKLVAYRLGLGK
jgi:uncharacterized SAM-binding protein YcdF (DUF218 family)